MYLVNVEIVFVVAGWEFDELTPAVEAAVADGETIKICRCVTTWGEPGSMLPQVVGCDVPSHSHHVN